MKVITFFSDENQMVRRAKEGNKNAQKALYENFSPKMLGVCRQYIRDLQFAEDVMITGFVKVFKNLTSFQERGSFEGWVRKIMIRECISYLRKNQFVMYDDDVLVKNENSIREFDNFDSVEQIQAMIDQLPEGYKMVFVLYAIEGYKHQEIAQLLHISEGTSKSQLSKARKLLQTKLKLIGIPSHSVGNP